MPDLELYYGAEIRMLPSEMDRIMNMLDNNIMPTLAETEYVLAEYVDRIVYGNVEKLILHNR
jgi:tyrosine-protein phosphatase YwqE